ncbi:MAG: dihydroorotate dehydrogenase electron transfer subunit [Acetatifactor sp.]|nr:dihydroorotate dehydrogenase electron transfer subunit [Acetatifactor sp.]
MNEKRKVRAGVLSQRMLTPEIYDMWLTTDLAADAGAGQFVGVYPADKAHLLPRPISICEVDRQQGALRLVYRIAGAGTAEFASWQPGQEVMLLGVLGNGFPVGEAAGKRVVLMGGGIGIPPMLELAKELAAGKGRAEGSAQEAKAAAAELTIIAGYRDSQLFLKEDLEKYGRVFVATQDGSAGIEGNVLTVMEKEQVEADVIMACGPMPMLRAVKAFAKGNGRKIAAYLSLEERMACGVGACLGCVCKTTHKDSHSHVNNARICTEGPVFEAGEVEL